MAVTQAEKMTAMESLIYAFARNQFAQNGITPAEARIVMECVVSKFRWNYIDSCVLGGICMTEEDASSKSGAKGTVDEDSSPGKGRREGTDVDNNEKA